MDFGMRLKELRKEHNLTQEELGKKIGVTKSSMSLYEKGEREPSKDSLMKMADIFGVSIDYLVGNTTQPSSEVSNSIVADKSIPVYGEIHAGAPTFADEHIIGRTRIPSEILDKYGLSNIFSLQVRGDSMNKVVLPNYVAVFAKDIGIENGDVVAVLIDGEEAAIKRYRETSVAVIFEPDSFNPEYQPIVFQKNKPQAFRILGKYVYANSMII